MINESIDSLEAKLGKTINEHDYEKEFVISLFDSGHAIDQL